MSIDGKIYYPIPQHLFNKDYKDLIPYIKKIDIQTNAENKMIYLREDDYIVYSQRFLKLKNPNDEASRLAAIYLGLEAALIVIKKHGMTEEVNDMYQAISRTLLRVSFDNNFKQQFKVILCSPKVKEYILKSILAKSIAYKLGWKSNLFLQKVFLASLFCDIGEEVINNDNKHHADISVELLKDCHISEDVLQAIKHHHEYDDGSGPFKITKFKIHPIAKIIRVVEESLMRLSKPNMAEELNLMNSTKLDSQILQACLSLFGKK